MTKKKFPAALKVTLAFVVTAALLVVFMLLAANIGGIKVSFVQMLRGLFVEYDEDVAIIVQLRFPRIFVAILGGMAMAVAGVITQAVMKSPLADPGIIGITAGSQFVAVLVTAFAPALGYLSPLFSFAGGMLAFVIVYALSWKGRAQPRAAHPRRHRGRRPLYGAVDGVQPNDGRQLFGARRASSNRTSPSKIGRTSSRSPSTSPSARSAACSA